MGSAKSKVNNETKAEVKPEVKVEVKPAVKVDVKPAVKVEVKEIVKEVPVPVYVEAELDKQVEELKKEVKSVKQVITDGVKRTFISQEDVLSVRYSQLEDLDSIKEDIKELFSTVDDSNILNFIIDTATSMITALKHSKEMKEVVRWHQRKLEKKVGSKVVGMEAHYKVKIQEKTKGLLSKEKETVVLIAYKVLVHSLEADADDYLDEEDLKSLTF